MEAKTLLIIGVIMVIGFLLVKYNSQASIVPMGSKILTQYTARPQLVSGWDSAYPENGHYYKNAKFILDNKDYLEFKATTMNVVLKKYCKTLPSDTQYATSLDKIYIDNDGCQHWKYSIPSLTAYWVCGDNSISCCQYYQGSTESGYYHCNSPHKNFGCGYEPCYEPASPANWLLYQPQVNAQNVADYGGSIYLTSDPISHNVNYGCDEEIKVYRNGILIDTLNASTPSSKSYRINNSNPVSVNVDKMVNTWKSSVDCFAVSNQYTILSATSPINSTLKNIDSTYVINLNTVCDVSDKNCNGVISRDELGVFITKWLNGIVSRDELGQTIQTWAKQ